MSITSTPAKLMTVKEFAPEARIVREEVKA